MDEDSSQGPLPRFDDTSFHALLNVPLDDDCLQDLPLINWLEFRCWETVRVLGVQNAKCMEPQPKRLQGLRSPKLGA